jgi:hypothetical protein
MTTLIDDADNLLLHQFSNAKNLKGVIRALVTPFQEALTELEKLHHGRYVDNAADETLDVIGAIVGQPRNGMSDDDYRPWLKVAICLNNSAGTAEHILNIIAILYRGKTAVLQIEERPPNTVKFVLKHPQFPEEIIKAIIRCAAPVTTNCQFMFDLPRDASPVSGAAHEINVRDSNSTEKLAVFQFDCTPFDDSYLLDFS